jgi:hypothetical protein
LHQHPWSLARRRGNSTSTKSLKRLAPGWVCLLAACGALQPQLATDPNALTPPTAAKSWAPEEAARIPGGKATLDAFAARSAPTPAAIEPDRVYDLPHLIDLAQRTNPETRAAWQATRATAARLGIAESAYLPTLGAIAMASYGYLADYDKMGPFVVRTGVLEPLLRLDWLLLDFGRRTADVDPTPTAPSGQADKSRMAHKSGICGSASILCSTPLILIRGMGFLSGYGYRTRLISSVY